MKLMSFFLRAYPVHSSFLDVQAVTIGGSTGVVFNLWLSAGALGLKNAHPTLPPLSTYIQLENDSAIMEPSSGK